MKILMFMFLTFLVSQNSILAQERRCGWLYNPSPGNWSLIDADGEWILAKQGRHFARGWDSQISNHLSDEWIYVYPGGTRTYGYGCACLDVVLDDQNNLQPNFEDKLISSIENSSYQQLAVCRTEPNLPPPPF